MHFGIISPPVSGHIHPMAALGHELMARGHRVSVLQMRDLEAKIHAEGLEFAAIGESDHPAGSLPESLAALGRLKGLAALRFTIAAVAKTSTMVLRDAPAAIRRLGIDALLVDQMEPAGGAVAEHLGLPFVTICNALALNREDSVPPPFSPFGYADNALARLRNRVGYAVSDFVMRPVARIVAAQRQAWGLPPLGNADDSYSRLAQICQMPQAFDYPRRELPAGFHYVGPIRRSQPSNVPFPWARLDGRPLVYASLGTLQGSREPLFRCFAEACRGFDVQLVLSHGGGLSDDQVRGLPGQPLVVPYAPQVELLARAALTLTHAGLNTVLDSLAAGVPLVTVPITYEQPAIAGRVVRCGAGVSLPLDGITPERLSAAIAQVLGQPGTMQAAQRLRGAIAEAGGTTRAAEIVESVVG